MIRSGYQNNFFSSICYWVLKLLSTYKVKHVVNNCNKLNIIIYITYSPISFIYNGIINKFKDIISSLHF